MRKKRIFSNYFVSFSVSLLALVCSCKTVNSNNASTSKAIIGGDERQYFNDPEVAKAIGVLSSPTSRCNAVLIGSSQVLTAAHCLDYLAMAKAPDIRKFSGSFFTNADGSFTSDINGISSANYTSDIAILNLTSSATDGWIPFDPNSNLENVQIMGFDVNKNQLVRTNNCSLSMVADESAASVFRYHNCDTVRSYSGSPLISNKRIVGVHIGYDQKANRNVAVIGNGLGNSTKYSANDLALISRLARETDCGTNCDDKCNRCVGPKWARACSIEPICFTACNAERVNACSVKTVKICGVDFTVGGLVYAACLGSLAAIPATCTGMVAASAGSSCAVNIKLSEGLCGVAEGTIYVAATHCIAAAAGVDASTIHIPH